MAIHVKDQSPKEVKVVEIPKPSLQITTHVPKTEEEVQLYKNIFYCYSQSEFNSKLEEAGEKLVVVDFFATWCGPCKLIAPKLEELSAELSEKIVIIKVDVDECEDLAAAYNISSMPTFVFIKNKTQVDSFSGANYDKLKLTINKHLS